MSIVVIWSRFGPYHLARLRGAAMVAADAGQRITGLEVAGSDQTYAWDIAKGSDGYERVTLFPEQSYESLSSRDIRRAIARALERIKPDAVATNGWSMPEARGAIAWCRHHARPVVLMSESKADDLPRRWWKEQIKRRIVSKCGAALVGGRAQAAYLRELGVPGDRIFLGYDVVDNDYFRAGATVARNEGARLRAQLGLPERYFFACTRFLPRKNLDTLLRAYAVYRSRTGSRPWSLVIAGGGSEHAALQRLESELEIAGVHWPGFVQYDSLPDYFGLASAFVHPARSEAWGLVINEALASGLPVVSSATVGASRELVEHGRNGYTFDPHDIEDIASKLRQIAEMSEDGRVAMAKRAQEVVSGWTPTKFGTGLGAAVNAAQAAGLRNAYGADSGVPASAPR